MIDFERLEEKASLYVMGDMAEADRREFEAQIAESTELAQLVRELEEGAVAVGLACPPRRPPPFLWRTIERAVERDRRKIIPLFGLVAWRNAGWAAAAACLAALIFVGFYRHNTHSTTAAKNSKTAKPASLESASSTAANTKQADDVRPTTEFAANQTTAESEARETEAKRLRNDLANLQRRVGEMSQVLTQQQAMLSEPNRLKFMTLTPAGASPGFQNLSPELQRAFFLAMARELGWLNSSNQLVAPIQGAPPSNANDNTMDIDFVDFRGGTNGIVTRFQVERPKSTSSAQKESNLVNFATEDPSAQFAALPAFATPEQVVLALDNSIAASGSTLNFSVHSGGESISLGSATMGSGPMVLRFNNAFAVDAWTFQVTSPGATGPGFLFFKTSDTP